MAAYAGDGQARGWFPELMSIPTGGHSVVSERFRHSGFELTHKERVRRIASNDRREEVAPKTYHQRCSGGRRSSTTAELSGCRSPPWMRGSRGISNPLAAEHQPPGRAGFAPARASPTVAGKVATCSLGSGWRGNRRSGSARNHAQREMRPGLVIIRDKHLHSIAQPVGVAPNRQR